MVSDYLKHEWHIIEDGFNPENNRASESIFSLGNGKQGQRANFEEHYSGDSLRGSYIGGIYYPDKTRVGWWKNGYPEYFAKVLNATNWIGIGVTLNSEELDLAKCKVHEFKRILNMKDGILKRSFRAETKSGALVEVIATRFLSMRETEIGAIRYKIRSINFKGSVILTPYLDLDVFNEDANYDEKFWDEVTRSAIEGKAYIQGVTKKTNFHYGAGMGFTIEHEGSAIQGLVKPISREKYVANKCELNISENQTIVLYKFVANLSSLDYAHDSLENKCQEKLEGAMQKGFNKLLTEHQSAWAKIWNESDIKITGDIIAQQGIRFNIFQLYQTYTGADQRLNIGPKGFTGEKYGGSTYWDTEAFALPFYLCTADPSIARNLLLYRYKHLNKAIENAEKLGFKDGAALYPMVTMNGEECHNEWEITFEEIHRNGAIAYAIYNYIRHTGDEEYLFEYGLEVLIAISRFWCQRSQYSENKKKYMILGVTGPNEYENNVNNNWYTNTMASWTLRYTIESLEKLKKIQPEHFKKLVLKIHLNEASELSSWKTIVKDMYFPVLKNTGIFLQQDGYEDKEQILASSIPAEELPINQHWSWDRILRSPFIKQADVLQGIYLFEDNFDQQTIKENFDYYEPRSVHESSLSPCVHSILAAKIGDIGLAYDLYLRTARLDLDDYNCEVDEGLHITSMAGTWLSIVEGFAGMRIANGKIRFQPLIPNQWEAYSFYARFRGHLMKVEVNKNEFKITNLSDQAIGFIIGNEEYAVCKKKSTTVKIQ